MSNIDYQIILMVFGSTLRVYSFHISLMFIAHLGWNSDPIGGKKNAMPI